VGQLAKRNGLRAGGGVGRMITPKMLIKQIHENDLKQAHDLQMFAELEEKRRRQEKLPTRDPNTGQFKRKPRQLEENLPTNKRQERENYRNSDVEAKKSEKMFDQAKRREAERLRIKRKEYEDFLRESMKNYPNIKELK